MQKHLYSIHHMKADSPLPETPHVNGNGKHDRVLLHHLMHATSDIIFYKDRAHRYIDCNDAFLRLADLPRAQILGRTAMELLPRDLAERALQEDEEVMRSKAPRRTEEWVTFPDGTEALYDTVISPLIGEHGEILGVMGVSRDITGLKSAEKRLRKQNAVLKKINTELDNLVYRAAHDLRAPLTSVLGLINVIRKEDDVASIGQYLDLQEKKLQRLDAFIQDIIHYSRNTRTEVENEALDMQALIHNAFEQLRFLPGAEQIALKVDIPEDLVVYSDAKRMEIILNNLISNAITYSDPSRERCKVTIRVERKGPDSIKLKVIDNGIGIAEQHLQRIYEMFYRATDTAKGSGIGLYITREAVLRLGGRIKVKSKLGEGTRFVLTLPNVPPKDD